MPAEEVLFWLSISASTTYPQYDDSTSISPFISNVKLTSDYHCIFSIRCMPCALIQAILLSICISLFYNLDHQFVFSTSHSNV